MVFGLFKDAPDTVLAYVEDQTVNLRASKHILPSQEYVFVLKVESCGVFIQFEGANDCGLIELPLDKARDAGAEL